MNSSENKTVILKQSAVILIFSTVLVKIIGALFKIPLASDYCLGDLGYGYFSSAYDVFSPVYFLAISGFPVVISRIISDYVAQNKSQCISDIFKVSRRAIFYFSIIGFVFYLILVFPIVRITDNTGKSLYSFLAVAPTIVFCFMAACYRGYYEGLGNMMPAAVSNIIEALGKLILGLGFAVFIIKLTDNPAFAAAAAIIGISLGTLASALYLHFKYKKNTQLKVLIDKTDIKNVNGKEIVRNLIIFSVPIVFTALSCSFVSLIDSITVRFQLSRIIELSGDTIQGVFTVFIKEYEQLSGEKINISYLPTILYGIRSKAYTLFNLIPTLTMAIGVALIPSVTSGFSKKDSNALDDNISAILKMTSLISFPASIGFIMFGQSIMSLLYGTGVSSHLGGDMLTVYGIAALFAGFYFPLAGILQAMNKQNIVFFNVAVGIILKAVLNILLCRIPNINIMGAAYSTLACFAFVTIADFIILFYKTGVDFKLIKQLFKPAVSAVISIVPIYMINRLSDFSVAIAILISALLYFVFLIIFNMFEESDIIALPMGDRLINVFRRLKIIR